MSVKQGREKEVEIEGKREKINWKFEPFTVCLFVCLSICHCFSTALGSLNVIKKRQFSDDRWTRGRIVSAVDWSTHVSYDDNYLVHCTCSVAVHITLNSYCEIPRVFACKHKKNISIMQLYVLSPFDFLSHLPSSCFFSSSILACCCHLIMVWRV